MENFAFLLGVLGKIGKIEKFGGLTELTKVASGQELAVSGKQKLAVGEEGGGLGSGSGKGSGRCGSG